MHQRFSTQAPRLLNRAPRSAIRASVKMSTDLQKKTYSLQPPGPGLVRVWYKRRDGKLQEWGLHVWGDVVKPTDWQFPLGPSGLAGGSIYWDVPVRSVDAHFLGLLVHVGETKSARAELQISDVGAGREVWLAGDEQHAFYGNEPNFDTLPVGSLGKQSAIWVSSDIIAWRAALNDSLGPRRFHLHLNSKGTMSTDAKGVCGAEAVFELEAVSPHLDEALAVKVPYLAKCSALRLPAEALKQAHELFQGQCAVSCTLADGTVLDVTGLQLQGGLDAHMTYSGPLGSWQDAEGKVHVAVWAPTARSVDLMHWKEAAGGKEMVAPMTYGKLGSGVWSMELPSAAMWTYFKFKVTVYSPLTQRIEVSYASDPNSRSLSADGDRTQIVPPDLGHKSLEPPEWHTHAIPGIKRWTDISIYELHIRDFSIQDTSTAPDVRGKYLGFVPERAATTPGGTTAGLAHLAGLREAGMNHLHLLPTYDFGSVPEREHEQATVLEDLSIHPADSEQQQAAVLSGADQDGFNWGYDPVHFGVPEGSYATNPDGQTRVFEFRQMVQALHKQGWRVVLDVVYNHVFASGPHNKYSVMDKVVPGYYQRRHEDGAICESTCCNNTATENAMCERLVVDDLVHWAKNYKVDGFRFDIMGHMMLSTLNKMRARLNELTPEKDGVDGRSIYIYGEAWDFGEIVDNARGYNCGQMNLSGTRLGSFNDRLRDGALGGGPFAPHDFQGLVTGLALAPNLSPNQGDAKEQAQGLRVLSDWTRFSLAGNLRQYKMETATGEVLAGQDVKAHGLPLAYGGNPCEAINFIGCHDNMTMFDFITEKASLTVMGEERVRMQVLCLALLALSQGLPFIHAGDDLLRSKSLDRDSYNSGDWFNSMDWTGSTHKLGVGLPVATKNAAHWHYKRPLLTNPLIKPTKENLLNTAACMRQLLSIRYSSPLFRLPSAQAICNQVHFHNTGPTQTLGVVVYEIVSAPANTGAWTDIDGTDVEAVFDPEYKRIVVVFNASPIDQEMPFPLQASGLQLHPLQAAASAPDARAASCVVDEAARVLHVPSRTSAVFVQRWA